MLDEWCAKYTCSMIQIVLQICGLFFFQLVSNAIQFLASVAERPAYRSLFEDPTTLANICEKVIVPNIQLRGRLLIWLL